MSEKSDVRNKSNIHAEQERRRYSADLVTTVYPISLLANHFIINVPDFSGNPDRVVTANLLTIFLLTYLTLATHLQKLH